ASAPLPPSGSATRNARIQALASSPRLRITTRHPFCFACTADDRRKPEGHPLYRRHQRPASARIAVSPRPRASARGRLSQRLTLSLSSMIQAPAFDVTFRSQLRRLLEWRRDVRRFRRAPLPEGMLERLLAIAALAPSVGLSQPWRFVA